MLTESQLQEYRDQGFVIIPAFFNADEVKALQLEVERFKREGLGHDVNPGEQVNYQIIPLFNKSDLMRAMLFNEKVLGCLKQMLGTEEIVRKLDQIFLKPAKHGSGTEWHQDNAYFRYPDPRRGMGMWIAVNDASRANGTLEVIPNTEDVQLEYKRSEGSDHHITAVGVDETNAQAVEVDAGGLVFFNYGILHCTHGNTTDKDRAGLAYHFLDAGMAEEPVEGRDPLVPLSGQGSTGGEKEYGKRVAGTWDEEVRKVLAAAGD